MSNKINQYFIFQLILISFSYGVEVTLENGARKTLDKRVVVSSPVTLQCAFSPSTTSGDSLVDWIYHKSLEHEEQIIRSGKVTQQYRDRFSLDPPASLQIRETVVADTGFYECKITILDDVPNTGKGIYNLTITVPPSDPVCQYTNDFALTLGSREEFRCRSATGIPAPTYTWFKDGQALPTDGQADKRYQNTSFTYSYETGTIVFSRVTPKDAGEYYCQAQNEVDSAVCQEAIIVTKEPDYLWLIGAGVGVLCGLILIGVLCYVLYRKGHCAACCGLPPSKRRKMEGHDEVPLEYHEDPKGGRAMSEYSGYSAGKRSEPVTDLDGYGTARSLQQQQDLSRYSKERLMDAPSEYSSHSRPRYAESSKTDDRHRDGRDDRRLEDQREFSRYSRERLVDNSSEYSGHSRRTDQKRDDRNRTDYRRDERRYSRERNLEDQREYSRYSRERLADDHGVDYNRDRRLEDQREFSRYSRERLNDAPSEYSSYSRRPDPPREHRRYSLDRQLDASSDYSSRDRPGDRSNERYRYSMPVLDDRSDHSNRYAPQGGIRVMP